MAWRPQEVAGTGCDEIVVILGSMMTAADELRRIIEVFGRSVLPSMA